MAYVKIVVFPGAGTIPAGLLENELRTLSKSDPDSHMNKLRTGCLGCCAVGRRLSVLLHHLERAQQFLLLGITTTPPDASGPFSRHFVIRKFPLALITAQLVPPRALTDSSPEA